ncbi:hypothetical protein [Variovorax sp. DXTD-1]|uniref:hypothetical protein n=1 Tax=Variovorax sp. DXTD-1 TaxID=2495592 RepID=UPI000F88AA85|nr:hypothetical protein [Variovorax sp. DXTD-1]RST50971.1 hypothetical protein EJI00_11110 [Variovorax sp. DXTD-1]
MDKLKIENYAKTSPGIPFPAFESLSEELATRLRDQITEKFRLRAGGDPLAMVRELESRGLACHGVNARDKEFKISKTLVAAGIAPSDHVYVNWYRLDDIDRLSLHDLDERLEDIWYPDSEDLDVFDDSLTWMLSIAHHGGVKLIRP